MLITLKTISVRKLNRKNTTVTDFAFFHGGLSVVRTFKHSPFHGADPQDHGRLSVEHISKLSLFFLKKKKTRQYVLDSLVRTATKW